MKIIWLSRHAPTHRQLVELKRLYGTETTVMQDSRPFGDAQDIIERFRRSGASEVVIVAPLSVVAQLCDRGLRPLWAEMELVAAGHPEAEVHIDRRDHRGIEHYRFTRFRRVTGVTLHLEDLE